jgi:Tfp pilus assembly protein PilV
MAQVRSDGLTLVEIPIALLLLAVGLLALAGTAATVTRTLTDVKRAGDAASLAGAQLEVLRAGGCEGPASGSNPGGRYRIGWTKEEDGTGTAEITVAVTGSGLRRPVFITSMMPCGSGE